MSLEPIITVENLSKRYTIRHRKDEGLRHTIHQFVTSPFGKQGVSDSKSEEFWALRDISFQVNRGEVLGVVGANGAGKSTLLKILSRITEPTAGRVSIEGRVASLLEVGTGFHPELTGRENIFVNGAILGLTRSEIKARFDRIVDFAEIEKFLDMPVKHYSSGMYVRLAFAVAAHLEPEILMIDEVLAVGDQVFQKKCIGKMKDVAKSGRTVLFVSHNMQAVKSLTNRCVLLQAGRAVSVGPSSEVVEQYLKSQIFSGEVYEAKAQGDRPEITKVHLHTSGPGGGIQRFGRPMSLDIEVTTPEAIPNAAISFQILTSSQQPVLHILNLDQEVPMLRSAGTYRLNCLFPKLRLYPGHYHLTFYFGASHPRRIFEAPAQICSFEVVAMDQSRDFYWYPDGALYVEDVEWTAWFRQK